MSSVLSCVLRYAKEDAAQDGLFEVYVAAQKWLEAGLTLAENAPPILINYFASLASKEIAAKTLIWLAVYAIVADVVANNKLSGVSSAVDAVGKINIPKTGFATPQPDRKCTGKEPLHVDSVSLPSYLNTIWSRIN